MPILLALAAAAASPQPGALKTFRDWIVGCDNGRACQAVSLETENGGVSGLSVVITRGGEAMARPNISLELYEGTAAALAVDGKRVPMRVTATGASAEVDRRETIALIAAMRNGAKLTALDARGKATGDASLSGLSAALLYMDEQQRRIGTSTALIRGGPKPSTAVPPTPAIPVIVSPPMSSAPPARLSAADKTKTLAPLECQGSSEVSDTPQIARLDARTTLALVPWPCGNGAYNYYANALLIDNAGKARPAPFDASPGMGEEIDNSAVNADWDPKTRRLSAFAKGRGLADCGALSSFAWDGIRFRLVLLEVMGECRGSRDYIPVWRAAVR